MSHQLWKRPTMENIVLGEGKIVGNCVPSGRLIDRKKNDWMKRYLAMEDRLKRKLCLLSKVLRDVWSTRSVWAPWRKGSLIKGLARWRIESCPVLINSKEL